MNVYLETSAVVKLLRAEPGSDDARAAASAEHVRTACVITYAETCSAVARRTAQATAGDAAKARRELDAFWPELHLIDVDEPLARRAADLAIRHRLRGMDAVHLAAALEVRGAGDLRLASWDRELRAAARQEGIDLLPEKLVPS